MKQLGESAKKIILPLIKKWVKNWKFLFGFFLSLIFINLFFLRWGLNDTDIVILNQPILKTYRVEGQAFYQKNESKKWFILSGEEQVSSGVQIQTYDDSRMILLFLRNPSRIEVAEKTLFSISETDREVILDFKRGEIFINAQKNFSDKKIVLKVGPKFFALDSTDIFVRGNSAGAFEIQVDYGKLVMQQDDKASTFTKGQVIDFRNTRDYSVQESSIQFSNPFNFDRYFVEATDNVEVRFAWTAYQKLTYAQLLIGNKPDNLEPFYSKPISLSRPEFVLSLGKGTYYWKLQLFENPKKSPVLVSKLQKFFIEPLIRIQPTFPEANSEFPLGQEPARVQFQWNNPSQLEKTFIEVSQSKNFSKLIVHESVANKNYYFYNFTVEGEYYWRINGFPFKSAELMTGVARKFVITKNPSKQPIRIEFPTSSALLTQNMLRNSDVIFEWKSSVNIGKYRVQIEGPLENKRDIKNYEYTVEGSNLKITQLDPGNYRWRVESREPEGFSSVDGKFRVLASMPIRLVSSEALKSLSWEKGPAGTSFYKMDILRVGTDNSLNEFFSNKKSTRQSFRLKKENFDYKNLSEGIYIFKVYALDLKNKVLADSNIKYLKVIRE